MKTSWKVNLMQPLLDPGVNLAFQAFPAVLRSKIMGLRQLIFETSEAHPEIGRLTETLKWGQPSYVTSQPKSGTTVRLGTVKTDPEAYAMYFHCQTDMVARIRTRFPDRFRFEGNRALIFRSDDDVPVDEIKLCLYWALTYHLDKKHDRRCKTS